MGTIQVLVIILGLLALGGGMVWLARRATDHPAPRAPQGVACALPDDGALRHQAARVERATERSAQIHREATRLADELRAYEAWRAGR